MNSTNETKGSRYQLQRYVNERPAELNARIVAALPELEQWTIEWASPLAADAYKEYRDGEFLEALGLIEHDESHRDFWPRRGARWDALARLSRDSRTGALLIEAKAHPAEANTSPSHAEGDRLEKIRRALGATIEHYGAIATVDLWVGKRFYQAANRLAHLHYFEKVDVPAWLVNVYFVDDRSHKPTSRDEWKEVLTSFKAEFGIVSANIPRCADVFLDAIND